MSIEDIQVLPVAGTAEPTTQATPTAGEKQQVEAAQETTDAPATSENDPTPETEQPEKPKRADGGFQRRINRLTADFREAQAKAAAAEARARELEAKLTRPEQKADEPRAPRLEDFRSYEEYERADRAFIADKTRRDTLAEIKRADEERQAAANRESEARKFREARISFEKSAEAAAQHYEDFDEAMDDFWRGRVELAARSDEAAKYIIETSVRKSELAYHLWANPEIGQRLLTLSPQAQVRELALLEASLPRPNAPATKAPNPPRTLGGRGGSDTKDPEKMTIDEMRKATGTRRKVDF